MSARAANDSGGTYLIRPLPADRAAQTARRKAIYELIHPDAKHGANQFTRSGQVVQSFADETAEATGKDARTIRRDAERGEKVSEEALNLVRGTAIRFLGLHS